jgi:hypothetical protein
MEEIIMNKIDPKYSSVVGGLKVQPCIGCGYCCTIPCAPAIRIHNGKMPCPSLIWNKDDKRHYCKLCLGEDGLKFKDQLYVGAGCSSTLFNEWRTYLKDRTKIVR